MIDWYILGNGRAGYGAINVLQSIVHQLGNMLHISNFFILIDWEPCHDFWELC